MATLNEHLFQENFNKILSFTKIEGRMHKAIHISIMYSCSFVERVLTQIPYTYQDLSTKGSITPSPRVPRTDLRIDWQI